MIHGRIGCRYLDGTADASTAVGAITAVLVGAGATGDEAGEDGVVTGRRGMMAARAEMDFMVMVWVEY